jgi:hypothetical protein
VWRLRRFFQTQNLKSKIVSIEVAVAEGAFLKNSKNLDIGGEI